MAYAPASMFSEPMAVYIIGGIAVILVGIAKAGFGGGVGVIATPLIALVLPPARAAAILLPLLCLCDLFSIAHYRRTFDVRSLRLLLPGALLGILLGALFFKTFAERDYLLKIGIGVIAILFVLFQVWRENLLKQFEDFHPNAAQGLGFGAAAGFTSTLAHAAGPVAVIFLLPQNLGRRIFVGTTVVFFTLVNAVKLIPYYYLDLLSFENLGTSAVLAPLVPLGVFLGITLNKTINEIWFNRIVYALTFLTGLKLVWDGIAPFTAG